MERVPPETGASEADPPDNESVMNTRTIGVMANGKEMFLYGRR